MLGRPSPDARDDVITPLYGGTQPAADALQRVREEFLASKAQLDEYRREVAKVRRLLANVPTYMICDDHDVTDDWFMTGGIRGRNLGNPFGRALVRNALAAYTVCQAWGNEPVHVGPRRGPAGAAQRHRRDVPRELERRPAGERRHATRSTVRSGSAPPRPSP